MVVISKNKKRKITRGYKKLPKLILEIDSVSPAILTYKCSKCKTTMAVTKDDIEKIGDIETICCGGVNCNEIYEIEYSRGW